MVDYRKWSLATLAAAALLILAGYVPACASIPTPRPSFGIAAPIDLNLDTPLNPTDLARLEEPGWIETETNPEDIVAENLPPSSPVLVEDTAIQSCNALFPFVTNIAGFATGIAMTTDPVYLYMDTNPLNSAQLEMDLADHAISANEKARVSILSPDVGRRDSPFEFISR